MIYYTRVDAQNRVIESRIAEEKPEGLGWHAIAKAAYDQIVQFGGDATYDPATAIVTGVDTRPMPNLTRRQFALMLLEIDMELQDIADGINARFAKPADMTDEAAIAALDYQRRHALIEFQEATEFRRNHWAVDDIARQLGFPKVQVDTLWRRALDTK